jgi:alpha-mannosidase
MNQGEPEAASRGRLSLIGHGHLDVVWLWQWPEGTHEAWATFRSALDRMAEHPEFCFVASSAAYYEWIERVDPEMLEEIRRRVEEGRWELVGGWWVEPDCNLPGGESLVRQALHGQRFFLRRFGRAAEVGFNPDSFGHTATLPQLLRKSGLTRYCFMRPGPHEMTLPGPLFHWESPDGSRVLALRIPFSYNAGPDQLERHIDQLERHIERCAAETREPLQGMVCFYGVGDHGGGPTRETIAAIDLLRRRDDGARIEFGTLGRFFSQVEGDGTDLAVHQGELQHHASGCYAAHSGVKRWSARAEQLLLAAEAANVLALRLGAVEAADDLTPAWRSLLFNQFHDVLAGTSIEPAYEDARDSFGEAAAVAARSVHRSLQAVCTRIDVPHREGTTPVVVFNPNSWPVRQIVEMEAGSLNGAGAIEDSRGARTPLQDLRSQATVGGGRRRVAFAVDVPALGYRVYRTVAAETTSPGSSPEPAHVVAVGRWRLEVDPATGRVVSIVDRRSGAEMLDGPARQVVMVDDSDTWSHDRRSFEDEAGDFEVVGVRRIADGPLLSVLRVDSRFGSSRLRQDFVLQQGIDVIQVRVSVDWRERQRALKLRWPAAVAGETVTYGLAHGHLVRPADGEEEPFQGWIDVSGKHRETGDAFGLSLLAWGKHSADVRGGCIGLTVLRSPAYAHHDPRRIRPDEMDEIRFIDQGEQSFTYALLPHGGGWQEAGTVRRAAELRQPPIAYWHTGHAGPLPSELGLLSIDTPNVDVVACKPHEDDRRQAIIRLLETAGIATTARVGLTGWDRELVLEMAAHELKTLLVPEDPGSSVREVNLLELDEGGGQ